MKRIKCCPLPYSLPSGSSANPYGEARSAEFDGTLVRDVLRDVLRDVPRDVLRDVLRDIRVYQKCPLKIFILCWYIDKVYTYLYM